MLSLRATMYMGVLLLSKCRIDMGEQQFFQKVQNRIHRKIKRSVNDPNKNLFVHNFPIIYHLKCYGIAFRFCTKHQKDIVTY